MEHISPPVTYYHSIAPQPFENWVLKWLTIRLDIFENHMACLKANHFKSIFLDDWFQIRTGVKRLQGKNICITFDDGYLDNWVYAYPVAKKYGMRFTLFVSPECIDNRELARPTLEDVWKGNCQKKDLPGLGYLTWKELKIMQESGVVDVQSHTMTHTKYIASSKIASFYYGGHEGMYAVLNANPELRPYYMNDLSFEKRLPQGTPLFEESSAVITRIREVNPQFSREVASQAKLFDFNDEDQKSTYESVVSEIHREFMKSKKLFSSVEDERSFQARLAYEIAGSKTVIEERLKKPVSFLCWPHGDNSKAAHQLAKTAGYLATTAGKMYTEMDKLDRIPRFGADYRHRLWLNRLKFHYKIASHLKRQPYYAIWLANEFKNNLLQKH